MLLKIVNAALGCCLVLSWQGFAWGRYNPNDTRTHSAEQSEFTSSSQKKFKLFHDKEFDFFPVPIIESRPDEGQSYGLMPVAIFSDKKTEAISIIAAAVAQYNSITKFSGAGIFNYYPHPQTNVDEILELYFEVAQRFYREASIHYLNPKFNDHFYLDGRFTWLKTPFPRFYGYGAETTSAGESNFVSQNYFAQGSFGYYFTDSLRANLTETFTTTNLLSRAFTDVSDTLTLYGGLPGVVDSKNIIHQVSVTYDTRPQGAYSKKGTFAKGAYLLSLEGLASDSTFQGYNLEFIQLIPLFKKRTVTALRFFWQDLYGDNIPFYLQSSLGGDKELRSFIPNRFTDTSKVIATWEQRINIFNKKIAGIPVEFYTDPFFEIGRVFHHANNLSLSDWQPVGGIGLRAFVPPNVVGRLDISIGKEGYNVYTMLGYAF